MKHESRTYPGVIASITRKDVLPLLWGKAGRYWKWLVKEDKIYSICDTEPPKFAGSRGQFSFKRFQDLYKT